MHIRVENPGTAPGRVSIIDPTNQANVPTYDVPAGQEVTIGCPNERDQAAVTVSEPVAIGDRTDSGSGEAAPVVDRTEGGAAAPSPSGAPGTPHQAVFEVFGSADGYRWRLKAPNGEIVAQSEGYEEKEGAVQGANAAWRAAGGARVEVTPD